MSVNPQLAQLEAAQLVRALDDLTYAFKHTLTQETAYRSLLKTKRAELHRYVAEALEELLPDQLERNAAMLALHYEQAGVDEKAFTYMALAGDVARRAFAHDEAVSFYDRALVIAERLPDSRWTPRVREVYANRGNVFEMMGNYAAAMENYRAMIALGQHRADLIMEADGLSHLLTTQGAMGTVADAEHQLNRALELAKQSGDSLLIGRALWNLGLSIRFQDPLRAADYFRRTLDHARAANLRELAAYALTDLTVEMTLLANWRLALEYAQAALQEFQAMDNLPMIANSLGSLALLSYGRGDIAETHAAAAEGVRISRSIENPWGIGYNDWHLFTMQVDAGEFDDALTRGEHLIELTIPMGMSVFIGLTHMVLVRIYLELGDYARAETLALEGARVYEKIHSPVWSNVAVGVVAQVYLRQGHVARARALLDPLWRESETPTEKMWYYAMIGPVIAELAFVEGHLDFGLRFSDWLLDWLQAEEMWGYAVGAFYWRARLHMARSDLVKAEADLDKARELAVRAKNNTLLWRTDLALGVLYTRCQSAERANLARQRAHELIGMIAEKISNPEWRAAYLRNCEKEENPNG